MTSDCPVAIAKQPAPEQVERTAAEAQYQLAVALELEGRLAEAAEAYRAALELQPDHSPAHANLGAALRSQGRLAPALEHLTRAVELDPALFRAHHNLAQVQHDLGNLPEAIAGYRCALQLCPESYESLVNLGTVLHEAGQFDEAVAVLRQAITLQPQRSEAFNNLGQCWQSQGRYDDSLHQFEAALRRAPDDAEIRLNRAFLWLAAGELSRGWREYEWRWRKQPRSGALKLPQPAWQGESLAGKSILIHAEQGLGDEIMFLSCLGDLLAEAAACTLTCDERLAPLVTRSFPQVRVIACRRGHEDWRTLAQLPVDCQAPAGALTRFLRPRLETFAHRGPFLQPEPALQCRWRRRLDEMGPGPKIGLAWRGGVKQPAEIRQRSIPPRLLAELAAVPGVQFVNLQHDALPDELSQIESSGGAVRTLDGLNLRDDLEAVAATLSGLDLVIAAAGATVHLAGAVGVPTWLLLPRHWGWRWLADEQSCLWYGSVRVLRQPAYGDWPGLVAAVRHELSDRTALRSAQPAPTA